MKVEQTGKPYVSDEKMYLKIAILIQTLITAISKT